MQIRATGSRGFGASAVVIGRSRSGLAYIRGGSVGYTAGMSKRLVDIDDDLLEEASTVLGAATMKEAVNRSLELVVLAERRRRHADRLEQMRGLDLADAKVMSAAWR